MEKKDEEGRDKRIRGCIRRGLDYRLDSDCGYLFILDACSLSLDS